ncbi:MAG: hypothetical protein KGJ86_00595, partial [Chloroflexota bacterium]|nr:hypothetical protein [Chloroflexota bacterium]
MNSSMMARRPIGDAENGAELGLVKVKRMGLFTIFFFENFISVFGSSTYVWDPFSGFWLFTTFLHLSRITASPHHRITASPHHRITASPHHRIT